MRFLFALSLSLFSISMLGQDPTVNHQTAPRTIAADTSSAATIRRDCPESGARRANVHVV